MKAAHSDVAGGLPAADATRSALVPWLALARHSPLGVLTDLDGTLIPFARTPREARLPPAVARVLAELAAMPGTRVALVSGRSRESLEQALPAEGEGLFLVAEHGAWARGEGAWYALADPPPAMPRDGLTELLGPIIARFPGAELELKSSAVAVHFRNVIPRERVALQVEVTAAVDRWRATHPGYAIVPHASATLEICPTRISKAAAAGWLRSRLGPTARLVVLGDDVSDEDMFAAVNAADELILIGPPPHRPTRARWRLDNPAAAVSFLEWLAAARREQSTPAPQVVPAPIPAAPRSDQPAVQARRLLVISNRLPEFRAPITPEEPRPRSVGGLVSALEPVLTARSGIWLGWSGNSSPGTELAPVGVDETSQPPMAWLDFPAGWTDAYYAGFCNRALWPLFHSFPGRVHFDDQEWR